MKIRVLLGSIVLFLACFVLLTHPGRKIKETKFPAFDIYLINLPRASDRLEHFREQLEASDLPSRGVIRFDAVDGASLDIRAMTTDRAYREIRDAETTGFRRKHYQLSRGGVGCYVSHVKVWESVLKGDKEAALIFEDDTTIHRDTRRILHGLDLPEDLDVLLLGCSCLDCSADKPLRRVHHFFGTHAYVITRRGCRKILEHPSVRPIHKQLDTVLSDLARDGVIGVYAMPQNISHQATDKFETSIQIPLAVQRGDDPFADDDDE